MCITLTAVATLAENVETKVRSYNDKILYPKLTVLWGKLSVKL